MQKKILVTGGCGYIGSHTCIELIKQGFQITILDSLINSNKFSIDRIREVIINFEERALITNVRVIDDADRNGYRVIINFQVLNSVENVSITEFLQRLR